MSFADDYRKLRNKRKQEEKGGNISVKTSGNSFAKEYAKLRAKRVAEVEEEDEIAPVITTTSTRKKDEDDSGFFQKGAFDDGLDWHDLFTAPLATVADAGVGVVKGASKLVGGVIDAGMYGVAGIADAVGADDFADDVRVKARENIVDKEFEKTDNFLNKYSVLGKTSDAVMEGLGQVGAIILTGGAAGAAGLGAVGATAVTTGAMGVSSIGSGMSEAYQGGATDEEAAVYGLISGVVNAGSELIFGGLGKTVKAIGLSKGLSSFDDVFAQKLSSKIANQTAKNFVQYGVKASAEGVEEVLAGIGTIAGKKLTYMSEEELSKLIEDENLLEQFVVGAVTSGVAQSGLVPGMKSGSLKESIETGRDFISGNTANEQAVIDKVYNDLIAEKEAGGKKLTNREKTKLYDDVVDQMEKGEISIETIEEVLGGDVYKTHTETLAKEKALQEEYDTLYKMKNGEKSDEQIDRQADLKKQLEDIKNTFNRNQLSETVYGMVQNDRLAESYYERSRRGQAFEADVSKYDEKQRAVVQSAIDSGILNNTRRSHQFVDILARISADKGVAFNFADNAKLKESGFAIEGKQVNGFVDKNGITVNVDSPKAWQSTVGHEITHVLEGTELYGELQTALFEYAKSKGEYDSRLADLTELYKDIADADVNAELTADLVGDYLFTDADFVNNLHANNRNVFQKIYDEIKYLLKVTTAGSKEAKQLEKVKKAFEDAYRGQKNTADGGMKYSLMEYSDHQKKNWATSKRIVVYENPAQLSQFIKDSVADNRSNKKMYFGAIPADLAGKIKGETGLNVENFNLSLGAYEIRKILKDHGNESVEAPRGQRAVVPDDFAHIVDVVLNPQSVKLSEDTYMGKPAIVFTGNHNGRMNVIAVVSDKRLDLFVQTVFVNVKKGNLSTPIGEQAPINTPEANSGTVSNGNVPQSGEKVKRKLSLSEPIEQTKDLMALHNLTEQKLMKSLKLGGLPMPSVAIAKAQDGHSDFGEISLVLPKDTIDPEYSRKNKLYSGDAWTPTYPRVEYKADDKVRKKIKEKISGLVPYETADVLGGLHLDADNLNDTLNRYNGDMVDAFKRDDTMKYAYLMDIGSDISLPVKEANLAYYGRVSNDAVRYFAGKLVNGLQTVELYQNMGASALMQDDALKEAVADAQNWDVLRTFEPGSKLYTEYEQNPVFRAEEVSFSDIDDFLSASRKLFKNGIQKTVDRKAARELIGSRVNQAEYEAWLNELFSGIVEKEGIRNNKDYFTPSGNRRSFDALHYEHNLENVIKAMRETGEKGIGAFGGGSIFGAATTEFSSVDEMKRASDRLQKMSDEEYQAMRDSFSNRFFEIAGSLPKDKSSFMATDDAANTLIEAVAKYNTRNGIANYLRRELNGWATYSDQAVDDLIELVRDIRNMPTGYFEAKPQRAVGFDEVGVFVIPNNADVKLKQELLNRGYSIAEYDPNIEGHRRQVVNQFEEYKFSLSNVGESQKAYGNFSTPARDLKLEAPVQETVAENATVEDTSPIQEAVTGEDVRSMFPDDLAPLADDPEQFDSLTDEDAPPERVVEHGEMGNQISLPKSAVSWIAKTARESLGLSNNQMADLHSLIEEYSTQEFPSKEQLFVDIKEKFGTIVEKNEDAEVKEVKKHLRNHALNVSDTIKNDITDYNDFRRANFGKVRFSRQGLPVDSAYQELSELYPEFFPDSITNPTDQLLQMVAVANYEATTERSWDIDDATLMDVVDDIVEQIGDYQFNQKEKSVAQNSKEAFDSLVESGDEYAPPVEDDIAPVAAKPTATPVETDTNDTEKGATRKELHASIVDGIKARFEEKGFDFDSVLSGAKNLSTLSTVDNTPQRVMEKALGYKEGQILSDMTVNQVAQNETEGIKWLNSFTDRKNGMLAKLSEQYNIKPGSKESAAAQMYAEGFYVDENNNIVQYGNAELAADFPDAKVQANIKGLAGDARIRRIYDDTLAMINESRARNAYPEIQRLDNYFLHFRAMNDTFSKLGLPFNPNDIKAKDLPTDLNGVTADLKPGQPFFASAMHRTGKRTSFDLLGGLEQYLTSAKNQIYHIDDIQTLRALRNYIADTYGQANGLEGLDALSEEEAQDRIEKVYDSHLSTFAKFLNEEANVLAGKTALIDRGLEGIIGRRGITFLDTLNKQVGSNMVGYNISSSLTNFIPVAQTIAKSNKGAFVKAFAQTVSNKISSIAGKGDGFAEQSPVMIRRKGADRFNRTLWQKVGDPGYALMGAVDSVSTELIARTKYNELIKKGMDSQQAHIETDKWVSRLMGDRSLGQQPQIYNSKMLGLVTKFQLEVRNQLDSQFYDTIQETKVSNEHIENTLARNAKTAAKVASTFVQLAVVQHLFGKVFESVAGYNPAFDIIEVLATTFGFDDEEDSEDTVLDNIEQGFLALLEDLPYTSLITNGGRIPISSALPIKELVTGKDDYGSDKSRWETLGEVAPYYVLPGGYGQIKKTVQGLGMFSDDLPIAGSYTDSGNLRFPVEDTVANRVQAGLFGQWASKNARDYFDNDRAPLKGKQIQEFIDVDIPIRDYWEYREGLNKQEDLESKFDYIAGLDLPVEKKNILINNVVDRKDDVDMANYDDFSNFEEFDFYTKNKEKYEFLQENGISYEEYTRTVVRKERYDSIYSWYKNNPEGVTLSKAVTDNVIEYRGYTSKLNDIRADKDGKGNSITGSAKRKKVDYINSLDLDYGQRLILFKSEYKADDTYNHEIIEYLNSRNDISYKDMVTILKELGFEVDSEGNIYWD